MNTGSLEVITGKKNKNYQLTKELGEGAFGTIYLAQDDDGQEYAVKKFTFNSSEQSQLDLALGLFKREVETLEKLNGHPNIPRFEEYIEKNNEFYFVQQYIPGKTLREEINNCNNSIPFSIDKAIEILKILLNILVYIHAKDIIHRDIKPDNIMIDIDNIENLFLIDFGAGKQHITNKTQLKSATRIYTEGYAPPEQKIGNPKNNSDIYAVGITIIELITRINPEQENINDDWHKGINISNDLKDILCEMIDDDYKLRYQSAQDVINALNKVSSGTATVLQNTQIIPSNKSHSLNKQSVTDMIFFGVIFTGIFIVIFNAAMLANLQKKQHQTPVPTVNRKISK
ncbi:serine/threonine-protein kinase [Anabaena sp. UHCC 0451]|uniref:serine/threonine-protein kinase n=1 Tax=Anabaena sp. UHCC 0451 TaxID=2055235 RepID=UPI002B220EA3|nr:serine/threonine-protein kinase [Anabaena sp. UHCC 0451]MEA5577721.1 serine/threonine-protein kinase [Anabaena sp. UHCC 0451]